MFVSHCTSLFVDRHVCVACKMDGGIEGRESGGGASSVELAIVWSHRAVGRRSIRPDAVVVANHSLVLRPPAPFKVTGKISVDTAPGRFIIILIR
jgi:hypothetical protein